jgi:hypothetical protein
VHKLIGLSRHHLLSCAKLFHHQLCSPGRRALGQQESKSMMYWPIVEAVLRAKCRSGFVTLSPVLLQEQTTVVLLSEETLIS